MARKAATHKSSKAAARGPAEGGVEVSLSYHGDELQVGHVEQPQRPRHRPSAAPPCRVVCKAARQGKQHRGTGGHPNAGRGGEKKEELGGGGEIRRRGAGRETQEGHEDHGGHQEETHDDMSRTGEAMIPDVLRDGAAPRIQNGEKSPTEPNARWAADQGCEHLGG